MELIVIIGLTALLAAIIGPRFAGPDTFRSRGFYDQATETVRFAQKISVASRQQVFVCITSTTITAALAAACGAPLTNPATGQSLIATAPAGVTLTGAVVGPGFNFIAPTATQAGGQPSTNAQVVITVGSTIAGDPARQIVIERETGYVHN